MIWSAAISRRFGPRPLDPASAWTPSNEGCNRLQPTKALTGQRTPNYELGLRS
jgi:hypothetical protein